MHNEDTARLKQLRNDNIVYRVIIRRTVVITTMRMCQRVLSEGRKFLLL